MERLKKIYTQNPFNTIIIVALFVRLVAAVFSQGYAFHDDHFLVVDAAQSWVDNNTWNNWMPHTQKTLDPARQPVPEGHSLFYPGLHYLLFSALDAVNITNPKTKMLIVRILHALFSLLVVSFGYKIAKHYSGQKIANLTGWVLALMWFMPFLSVRNLVEMFCIPFLMWALFILIKNEQREFNFKQLLLAGFIMGIGFSVRFQTIVIIGGAGLVMLARMQIKQAFTFALGAILSIIIIQGGIDMVIWNRPFAELTEYVLYNLTHKDDYGVNNYYMFITLVPGLMLFPLGIFAFVAWFFNYKTKPYLFWPSFLFFAFHTYFTNKQERFILPIVPIIIVAGIIAWWQYMGKSGFWLKHAKLFKNFMMFFWVLNFILLPVLSTTYTKRSRCESMYFFNNKNIDAIIVEETTRYGTTQMPNYYAGKNNFKIYGISKNELSDTTQNIINDRKQRHFETISSPTVINKNNWPKPNYILFINQNNLNSRVDNMRKYYPGLTLEKVIEPGYVDIIMRKLSPTNNNQYIYIYKI